MSDYDLVIIGGGPAGLAAGIYAARRNLKCIILSETAGGLMSLAHMIENYPGVDPMPGIDLAERMKKQAEKFGCEFKLANVVGLDLKGETKKVSTHDETYSAKAILITTGGHNKKLGVEGEDKFVGKGVSYCAACDGFFFKKKKVAVIGGSDCAVSVAAYLSEIASEVFMVHRRDELRAEEANQAKLNKSNIKIVWDSVVERIDGDKMVNRIVVKNVKTGASSELAVDGVFIECGEVPTTEIVKAAGIEVNENNFIKVNSKFETNVKGVFAAGIVTGSLSQVIVAAGEGAQAATNAYAFVKGESKPDYGVKK